VDYRRLNSITAYAFELSYYKIKNNSSNSNFYKMGVTSPEDNTSQSGIRLRLDLPVGV